MREMSREAGESRLNLHNFPSSIGVYATDVLFLNMGKLIIFPMIPPFNSSEFVQATKTVDVYIGAWKLD